MTYVDRIRVWPTKIRCFKTGSCHLIADTHIELMAFAKQLGLKESWVQRSKSGLIHFDLTPGRREKALRLGAKYVDGMEWVKLAKDLRTDL